MPASQTIFDTKSGGVVFPGTSVFATDPTAANDVTQGFVPGSQWINSAGGRSWQCVSNAAGAAVWSYDANVPGSGAAPSSLLTQFGSGSANFPGEGNIYRQISIAGIQPGALNADNVLAVFTLPASSFDVAGRGVNIVAEGSFASNTNSKRTKIYFNCTAAVVGSTVSGGTVIADSGNYATTGAVGWSIEANVFKAGAAGSNTQIGLHQASQIGATVGSLLVPVSLTAVESGAIIIAVTGDAVTALTDILLNFVEINAMN